MALYVSNHKSREHMINKLGLKKVRVTDFCSICRLVDAIDPLLSAVTEMPSRLASTSISVCPMLATVMTFSSYSYAHYCYPLPVPRHRMGDVPKTDDQEMWMSH